MKERPILFSGPMVRALLDGRKTQTRRVAKLPPRAYPYWNGLLSEYRWVRETGSVREPEGDALPCPYGAPNDRLWVRETWGRTSNVNDEPDWPRRPYTVLNGETVIYSADGPWQWCDGDGFRVERSMWKPSIHMPRLACRIVLEVVRVRIERVRAISYADAVSEGAVQLQPPDKRDGMQYWGFEGVPSLDPVRRRTFPTPQMAYENLWDTLNAQRGQGWRENPWVWAIDFKRTTT